MLSKFPIDELIRHESRMQQLGLSDPHKALEVFFADFTIADNRKKLWELYKGWMMSERSRNCDPGLPADLLFYYTHLEMLVEAAWLLHQEQKQPKK